MLEVPDGKGIKSLSSELYDNFPKGVRLTPLYPKKL